LQELALRILLRSIAERCAVYGRVVKPVLSVGMNFYVRVFVEVWDDKAAVNKLSLNIGTVYQSTQCPSFHVIPHGQCSSNNPNFIQTTRAPRWPKCPETNSEYKTGGPIWLGPLHNDKVVREALDRLESLQKKKNTDGDNVSNTKPMSKHLSTMKNLHGLLTVVSEELHDVPLYYTLPTLCHTLGCQMPPRHKVRAALINGGYRVSTYHKEPNAIKTDAPSVFLWDMLRVWCKEHPPNLNGGSEGGGGKKSERRRKRKMRKMMKQNKNEGGVGISDEKKESQVAQTPDGDDKDTAAINATTTIANNDASNKEDNENKRDDTQSQLTAAQKILSIEPTSKIDFTIPDCEEFRNVATTRRKESVRFPMNPEANWGPKAKASGYDKNNNNMDQNTKKRLAKDL